jgi:hypothetical protein
VFENKIKRVQACINAHGHHFQHLLKVHSDFLNADLQNVFENKIKRVQACINAHGHHFQHLLKVHSDFLNAELQKVFANKIKRVQACIDAHGHHFQHLCKRTATSQMHCITFQKPTISIKIHKSVYFLI